MIRGGAGELSDGAVVENQAKGQAEIELFIEAGDDLGGEEGMAAEVEEIFVRTEGWILQDVAPDAKESLLERVAGSAGGCGSRFVNDGSREGGEGSAIDFAVGVQGKRIEHDEPGWDEVFGQLLFEKEAQGIGVSG